MNFTGDTKLNCDDDEITNWDIWYRVSGNAGNALAASTVPPQDSCGTETRLYIEDDHPDFSEGEVSKRVCVSKTPEIPCRSTKDIQVINCGAFYLYNLVHLRKCPTTTWAYCTNGQGMYHRLLCRDLRVCP